ncbi:MAG: kinase-like domain-containing protein [Podila humilis]|nr:MAG: kinase-like domain-containing protein [Podila humilis]
MSSSHYSSTPTTSTSSPSFFPRPVFASDLAAQKAKKFSSAPSSTSSLTPGANSNTNKPQRSSQQYLFGTTSSSTTGSSSPGHSMMDLSSKLGDLPTIQLPDFHLPDLHRLKQQLHKHTPSFSLKSLQHTFNVPSYTSFTSTGSSTSSSASATPIPGSRHRLSSLSSRQSSTRSSKDGRQDSSLNIASSSTLSSSVSASASASVSRVSESKPQLTPEHPTPPIAIPPVPLPHPSNYLIKKANPSLTSLSPSTLTLHSSAIATTSSSPIVLSTATEISTPTTPASLTPTSSKSPVGHLFLQIIEARNLTLVNPQSVSRPYCLVEYDQNELMTPPALAETDTMGRRGTDIFTRAMAASSPKWRHDAEFDVVRPNQQISITIYDSCGDEIDPTEPAKRFLGQVRLKPSEIHNRMIDSWFRLQGREAGGEQVTGEIRVTIKYQAIESRHLSTADFDILRVLGIGSFGKVYQVRKKDTGRIYAMKVLNKKQIIEQKQVEHTIAERNVLVQALQSPFIVGLKFSFQTPTKLYLVQDFMNGGELFFHMQNEGTFSEARARFYTAELVLALEHLHSCNVVYRDLKPENILLSSQGHIVLVDFGLCKQNVTEDERTHTFCGTTEYLAPEIVKGTGYGKAVDWWSLGVLLYEMLVGASPFADTRTEGTYHKILHQPVIFPSPGHPHHHYHHTVLKETSHKRQSTDVDLGSTSGIGISHNAQDLIQRFLDKNSKTRLGSGNGMEAVVAIKSHPFFKGIDFERLQTRDVTPPFQPHVGVMGDLDVSNFDAHFTDQTATLGMNSKKGQASYLSSSGSSPSSRSSSTLMDGQAGAFYCNSNKKPPTCIASNKSRATIRA